MMIRNSLLTLFCLFLLLSGCENDDKDQVVWISYGTTFGECLGYCSHTHHLTPIEMSFRMEGWWPDSTHTNQCTDMMVTSTWINLVDDLDRRDFLRLDEVIGCPDCTDGGAEWIEVRFMDGTEYKVTFEYQNEPKVFEDFMPGLRLIMEDFEDCETIPN